MSNTPDNYAFYESALRNFTSRLLAAQPAAKHLFISTTPFMPLTWWGQPVVETLNAIAQRVVAEFGVPYADLYSHITARCGKRYTSCDICDAEPSAWNSSSPAGSHCGYHYTPEGYQYISDFLSPVIKALL